MKKILPLTAVLALLLGACTSAVSLPDTDTTNDSASSIQAMTQPDGATDTTMPPSYDEEKTENANDEQSETTENGEADQPAQTQPQAAVPSQDGGSAQARVIQMGVTNWSFSPNSVTVKKGEKVTIHLTGGEGMHSFTSEDLGINVPIGEGETKDVVIPTDKAGTFSFRCAVPCGPGHREMTGTIVVE